jgi:hypothetical protein
MIRLMIQYRVCILTVPSVITTHQSTHLHHTTDTPVPSTCCANTVTEQQQQSLQHGRTPHRHSDTSIKRKALATLATAK